MKKTADVVLGRDDELAKTMGFLEQGASVDVVGPRASGRSTFLKTVHDRLKTRGSTVVTIHGNASLRQHPLAALQLTGVLPNADGRLPTSVPATADALAKTLLPQNAAILIDDWDDLDETSWGVVEAVRRATGTPVVLSRLLGRSARHTPTGLEASSLEHSYVVDLVPFSHDALEAVLRSHLGGDIESHTLSRIFAKSGGVVGLARNVVDAAVRDGTLSHCNGVWEAADDLWSRSLRGVLEAYLEGLDDAARDAIELLALVGIADVATARKLIAWETLESLESQGFIRFVPSGDRQLVAVTPPLLVEFFRHEPLAARRIRLTEMISERLGGKGREPQMISALSPSPAMGRESDALFVRLIQERVRSRRLVARAAWEANPITATAVDYIDALVRADAPVELLRDVLHRTDATAGSPLAQARFAVALANATAYIDRDPDAALLALSQAAAALGPYGRIIEAAAVTLQAHTREIPADFASRLEVREDDPVEVKVALWESQLLLLISLGRFSHARRIYQDFESCPDVTPTPSARALFGLALLGEGSYERALAWSTRGVEEARGLLDIDGARAHGAVASLCKLLAGDYQPVEQLLEILMAAGNPLPFPSGVSLMLANVASVIASRRGDGATAERFAEQSKRMRDQPGPLPGQASEWAEAQVLAFRGRHRDAADLIWSSSEGLWVRGARFSAALGFLVSVEIMHDDERLRVAAARAAEVGGGLLASHAALLRARQAGDPDAHVAAFDALRTAGRHGLALSALRKAAELYRGRGDARRSSATEARAKAFAASLAPRWIDTARFVATAEPLTERELEVARLVAKGLSNPEVADRLVLSVRTVESHMNRIMRKLNISSRQAVKWFIESRAVV